MVFVGALVVGIAILFILSPLLGWGSSPAFDTAPAASAARALLQERQELLASIKDLELEYEIGKLTKEDFEQQRDGLSRQAVEVYRQIDHNEKS